MKLRLHIWHLGLTALCDGTATCARVDLDSNRTYETQEQMQELKSKVAAIYGSTAESVMTDLEYHMKLLEAAETKFELAKEMYSKQDDRTQSGIVLKVETLNLKRQAKNDLGTARRKVTKLRKQYEKAGIYHPDLV